jgi:hypothetical protein
MRAFPGPVFALSVALLLFACGGSKPDTAAAPAPPENPRGKLLQKPPELATTVSAPVLLLELRAISDSPILTLGGSVRCDVAVYHMEYTTVGGANEPTTASGALMVPVGLDSSCRGSRPMLLYAHGTSTDHAFNIADLVVQKNGEGFFMAFFAAQGYIVVAPNFAGYDTSTLPYHPYLVADQQSKDMIDALTAARSALPTAAAPLTRDDGRLFITGYSQGGYVAMATHRAMQAGGMTVTASAPMSGPYALGAFVDAIFHGRVNGGATVSSIMLVTGYQNSYRNIYTSVADVIEPQYATGIESLLPAAVPRGQLYALGKLPQYALFSATPPAAGYADITPATTPAGLAPVFALGFGAGNLMKNSYRLSYLLDAQAHPDGAWPTTTTGMPAAAPALPLRQALANNDLRNWTPTAPILLCGGSADPIVFWQNTQLMQGYWASRAPASARISVLDVDSAVVSGEPYAGVKQDFARAKQLVAAAAVLQGATDGGARAVAEVYHAPLVPPFCLAAVNSFFGSQ